MSVVIPPTNIIEVELAVQGMTCAACAARIEKTLNEIDGVEAAVKYATETAMVAFDGESQSKEAVLQAISNIGYSAHAVDDESFDEDLSKSLRIAQLRLVVSLVFSVPVVLLSMVESFHCLFQKQGAEEEPPTMRDQVRAF